MPVRVANLSAPNIQAGEKRGEIAAHKYEGLTIFQRTTPRKRNSRGKATVLLIIIVNAPTWGCENHSNDEIFGTISWLTGK